jgi:hypothetical protein
MTPFLLQQGAVPETEQLGSIGVLASTPLVEMLYMQLLTQAGLPGAVALGQSKFCIDKYSFSCRKIRTRRGC